MSAPDPLRAEHESLQRAVQSSRRSFQQSELGAFATAMQAAMTEYHTMRASGVSREDACKGLEAVLRDVWPHPPTKFPPACTDCDGTGWREKTCWHEQRCGRESCQRRAHPSLEHAYVVPCECPSGDRFRPKLAAVEDAVVAVGRTQKRKGFTRFGQ